jgi:predicted ATPase
MITTLSLRNFKAFKHLERLDLKDLTILVGRNSCGKSSIIHSLLLLKQTLESESENDLCIEGRYLKYSSLKEISHGSPSANRANIEYEFGIAKDGTHDYPAQIRIAFKNDKRGGVYVPSISHYSITKDDLTTRLDRMTKSALRRHYGQVFAKIESGYKSSKTVINKFVPWNIDIVLETPPERDNQILPNTHFATLPFLAGFRNEYELTRIFAKSVRSMRYLSPLRARPERAYIHYTDDAGLLDVDGSNSAHVLFAKRNETVIWKKELYSLEDAVNKCVKVIGLSQTLTPARIGSIIYRVGMSLNGLTSSVSLADVGFGYSQILPLILLGLLSTSSDLMLVEQPEIHLHPASAANLADLFLGFVEDGKRFLVETHSQEFINKLRLRVIQNPELKSKINVVFVEQDEFSTASVKQFQIDENGMFPEWPQGFVDTSESLALQIINARIGGR